MKIISEMTIKRMEIEFDMNEEGTEAICQKYSGACIVSSRPKRIEGDKEIGLALVEIPLEQQK